MYSNGPQGTLPAAIRTGPRTWLAVRIFIMRYARTVGLAAVLALAAGCGQQAAEQAEAERRAANAAAERAAHRRAAAPPRAHLLAQLLGSREDAHHVALGQIRVLARHLWGEKASW